MNENKNENHRGCDSCKQCYYHINLWIDVKCESQKKMKSIEGVIPMTSTQACIEHMTIKILSVNRDLLYGEYKIIISQLK